MKQSIHLLGPTQACSCKAHHVCQSCQGQDERLCAVNAQLLEALANLLFAPTTAAKDAAHKAIKEARK